MARTAVLEIVATSAQCAQRATAAGADRLEACEVLELGGITPGPEVLDGILGHRPALGVHALLRSRPGDFVYSEEELRVMERQARRLARAGVDGLVLGTLDNSASVDLVAVSRLAYAGLEVNPHLEITLHRAIDASADPVACLAQILGLGVHRVLTSGGRETAGEGLRAITQMVQVANGGIQIMAGGGLRAADIKPMLQAGVSAVHFSAKKHHAGTLKVSRTQVQQLRSALDTLNEQGQDL
ncbi:copper homeostasis protein CutC [Glutamicibacter sp. NPDC087344]|uniref:copper homeostasis protein CutC n=1 Tax=Glutamicibacter sp. NPDC087344 TaxID=3363994 RepID=UPI003804E4CD